MATKKKPSTTEKLEHDLAWFKKNMKFYKHKKARCQQELRELEEEEHDHIYNERAAWVIEETKTRIKQCKKEVQQCEEWINKYESDLQGYEKTNDKAIREQQEKQHIEACDNAMKENNSVDQTIIQGVMFGFPRSGKSSLKDRLAGKMRTIEGSTGAAEKVAHVEITMCQVSGAKWRELDDLNSETVAVVGKVNPGVTKPTSKSQSSVNRFNLSTTGSSLASVFKNLFKRSPKHRSQLHARSLDVISSSLQSLNLEELESYMEDTWTLYMTDTGGQPEFQELLPVLVSGPALFFLVFRLNKDLYQKYTIEYLHPTTGKSVVPFEGSFSMAEMILQSLASIASTRMQSFIEDLTPKIVFVGTHKDQLKSQKDILKVDKELQRIVKTTDAFREGMVVFATESRLLHAVDNTSEDDADFRKVRATVEKIAQSPFYRISTPFSWLMLGILLSRNEKRVMSYDECLENGKECGIKSAAELDLALWFLHHRVGIIRHFQSVPTLQHVIIKDPQYIFDKVTELIVNTFTFERANMFSNAIDDFQKRGIFLLSTFEKIAADYDILTSSKFIALMEHLHIIAPLHEGGVVTKYFLPCALTHATLPPDTEVDSVVPPLLVTFNSGYCPRGVFGSLVVHLIKEKKEHSKFPWEFEQDKIYRNQVQMSVGPYDCFRFHLHSRYIRIDLVFSSPNRRGLALGRVCCDVRQCVHKSIEEVTESLNYSVKASHTFGFPCPLQTAEGEIRPATINFVDGVPHNLKDTQTGKRIALPDGYQFWFDETHELSAGGNVTTQTSKLCKKVCPKSIINGIEAAYTELHYNNDHPHLAIFCPHTTDDESPSFEQQPSSQPTPSNKNVKPKPQAEQLMADECCWMCTESKLFGELNPKHDIWLTEQVPTINEPPELIHKEPPKDLPASDHRIRTDFVPMGNIPDDMMQNSATLRWKLSEIHNRGINGEGIVIAILDDGINIYHNAFKQAKRDNPILVQNFVPGEEKIKVSDCEPGAHGTMAVFIAGGEAFSNVPCGVAPNATLLLLRVGKNEYYSMSAVTAALKALIEHREAQGEDALHIVSMSFGMPYDPDDKDQQIILSLILKLKSLDVVCVASAGNYGAYEGGILFPACSEDVISVGALTVKGYSRESNAPTGIDVLAPGENVPVPSTKQPNKAGRSSGSSCAAPAIAGLVALMMHYAKKCESNQEDRKKYRTLTYIKLELEKMKADTILEPIRFFHHRLTDFEQKQKIERLTQKVKQLKHSTK